MKLVVGAATDVGRVRETNEDSYLVDETIGLVAIADGMGGHRAGEVASATALEALRASVNAGHPLREAIEEANDAVFTKSTSSHEFTGMGTTLTVGTLAAGGTLLVGHVGDSRAYLLRDSELRRLTNDHSRVQELVDDGRLTADEAAVHPMRNIVTRAVGVDPSVDVDVYPVELKVGDRVLFCSDGLTDMLHDDAIASELRREGDPARAAQQLVDAANVAGGVDNITVLVVGVSDEDARRGEAAPPVVLVAERLDEPADLETVPRRGRARTVGRVLLWVIPILVILGVAIGAVAWYARHSYYVSANRGRVTVYQGVPGGLLWFDPTIARRTGLRIADLRPGDAADVRDEPKFSSRADANAYVRRIRNRATPPTTTTTTTTTTTPTTTTVAPTTTVPPTTAAAAP
ncbi:MAG TPA: Stp1/IreP family PP2C-type Ser/Thr phosphatase [Acidimicrobiia bacterium]|nr:Stp1/IreP family PP2C-type Ser/Thr phosphatase [Acidimicrobiia bacterium]